MPLYVEDGKLIVGSDGNLQGCCCDVISTPCPNCCTKLVGGTFAADEWTFTATNGDYTMTVVVTGIGSDGIVCDEDIIGITSTLSTILDPDPISLHLPIATWDQAWRYFSSSPALAGDGVLNENGRLTWGSIEETTVSLSLKYDHCYNKGETQFGDVYIGYSPIGLYTLLSFENCSSGDCCNTPIECRPCCWYIPTELGEEDRVTNEVVFWDRQDGYALRVSVTNRILYCEHEGGLLVLNIEVIPAIDAPALYEPGINISHDQWFKNPFPPDDCGVGDPDAFTTTLPATDFTGFETFYAYECRIRCAGVPGIVVVNASPGMSITFSLASCDELLGIDRSIEDSCQCCPSEDCCGECTFPVTPDACDNFVDGVAFETGGPTQIVNLTTTVTASANVFCDNTTNTMVITQDALSRHAVGCRTECVADVDATVSHSRCFWGVEVKSDCDGAAQFTVIPTWGSEWGISSGGVGWIYWVTGRTSYSGDCTGATASGTYVAGGVTYNWTTTFEVTGSKVCENPAGPIDPDGPDPL